MVEIIFKNGFVAFEYFLKMKFSFQWIKPDILGKVINENDAIFKTI